MYGVIIPGVSAGSNHDGAKDTCTPQVICPSGAAPAAPVAAKTCAPASAADSFKTSRRLRLPKEYFAIFPPSSALKQNAAPRHAVACAGEVPPVQHGGPACVDRQPADQRVRNDDTR